MKIKLDYFKFHSEDENYSNNEAYIFEQGFECGIEFAQKLTDTIVTPPENETLIIKDTNNEYHIGYYRNGLYIKSGGYILNAISWRPLFYE